MKYFLITAIFLTGTFCCRDKSPKITETKIIDFGIFTINTPTKWKQIKQNGIDSHIGKISLDDRDTIEFDYGYYSNNLYEFDPEILDSSMMAYIDSSSIHNKELIFVKDRRRIDPDKYRRNNVTWDTIDGRKAKIVYPRRTGIGTTGVYIDSVSSFISERVRFNLYGENLKPENEREVLNAIKTLKFHKK